MCFPYLSLDVLRIVKVETNAYSTAMTVGNSDGFNTKVKIPDSLVISRG